MKPYQSPAPSVSRTVQVDGGLKLHYLDYGQEGQPPMLCLHGGQAHAHWYDFTASAFTASHHVIALDQRGHGDSAWSSTPDYTYQRFADDVAEVVQKLDLRDFTLVGHSVGAVNALLYAAKYHDRMKRMILVDGTFTTNPQRVAEMREKAAKPLPSYPTREELVERYKLNPPEHSATPEQVRYLASFDAKQNQDGSWKQKFDTAFYAQRDWDNPYDAWKSVKVPVLIMKADQSPRISPAIIAEVTARCPTVTVTTIANSNHHVMFDNPEAYVAAIKEFVAATK